MQTITLQVPDNIYQRARRTSEVLQRPTEKMLVEAIAAALPPLEDTPPEMAGELAAMALLSDEMLESIARATLSPERQHQLDDWLDAQQRGELDQAGQHQLAAAMAEYGRTLLRRSHAIGLLLRRGRQAPPLGTLDALP
jgi:hypothetical protein